MSETMLYSSSDKTDTYQKLFAILLMLLPIGIIGMKTAGDLLCFLTFLLSLGMLKYRTSSLTNADVFFVLAFTMPLFIVLLQLATMEGVESRYMELGFRFALPVVIFYLVRKVALDMRWLGYGCLVALLYSCFLVLKASLDGVDRPSNGFLNSITFSGLSVTFSFIALFLLLPVYQTLKQKAMLGIVVFSLCGTILSITLSRGALLTLGVAGGFFLLISPLKRSIKIFLLVAGGLSFVGSILFHEGINQRFFIMEKELRDYFLNDIFYLGSIPIRLEIYKGALYTFLDNPLLGTGSGLFEPYFKQVVASGIIQDVGGANHAHNELLNMMAEKGSFGVLAYGLMLGVPFYFFNRHRRSSDKSVHALSMAGISTVVVFALIGMTDVIFLYAVPTTFYSIVICLLASQVLARIPQSSSDKAWLAAAPS